MPIGECLHAFRRLVIFFKINFFENFFQECHQSVSQFGSISGGMVWVKTVFTGYHQTTLVGRELKKKLRDYSFQVILKTILAPVFSPTELKAQCELL